MVLNVILSCNSVFQHDLETNHLYLLKIIISAIGLILLKLYNQPIKKTQYVRIIIFLFFYFTYIVIFYILSVSLEQTYRFLGWFGVLMPILLICFWIYNNLSLSERLLKVYSNIMIILAIISLIMWFSCSIASFLPLNTKLLVGWGRNSYIYGFFNIYYETQSIDFLFFSGVRNTGIFIEAPMYSFCLSLALLIELFIENKVNKKRIMILIVTIMTTVSTTGIGCILLSLFLKYTTDMEAKEKGKKFLKIIFSCMFMIIVLFISNIILENKYSTNSFSVRMNDLFLQFEIWKNNFWIGKSFNSNQFGSSNSIMVILADGGLFLGVFYLIPFKILWENKIKEFSFILLIIFSFTVIPYTGLTFFILAYIYSFYICKNEFRNVNRLIVEKE